MTEIHHANCGTLDVPGFPKVVCHCLVLADDDEVVLVDTGIGLCDVQDPEGRLGRELIDAAGFRFNEHDTAVRRLEQLGIAAERVRHIILTHGDPDHVGGLADFPQAEVHLAEEELRSVQSGHPRYVSRQFSHGPHWRHYGAAGAAVDWFGMRAYPVDVPLSTPVLLLPLPGHTNGHCGVVVGRPDGWMLHVGDAYYLRVELTQDDHPVSALASARADDDQQRKASLTALRHIRESAPGEVTMFGYHDITELPASCIDWD